MRKTAASELKRPFQTDLLGGTTAAPKRKLSILSRRALKLFRRRACTADKTARNERSKSVGRRLARLCNILTATEPATRAHIVINELRG